MHDRDTQGSASPAPPSPLPPPPWRKATQDRSPRYDPGRIGQARTILVVAAVLAGLIINVDYGAILGCSTFLGICGLCIPAKQWPKAMSIVVFVAAIALFYTIVEPHASQPGWEDNNGGALAVTTAAIVPSGLMARAGFHLAKSELPTWY